MLQSEFFERTKVNLTGEEYREVERMYESVKMDKDAFCILWSKNRNNQIISELMDTIKKLEAEISDLKNSQKELTSEIESSNEKHEKELQQMSDTFKSRMEDFGEKLVKSGENDFPSDIYDVIEEEFGIDFIIKSKWKQSIELSDSEIDYMVSKLQ